MLFKDTVYDTFYFSFAYLSINYVCALQCTVEHKIEKGLLWGVTSSINCNITGHFELPRGPINLFRIFFNLTASEYSGVQPLESPKDLSFFKNFI